MTAPILELAPRLYQLSQLASSYGIVEIEHIGIQLFTRKASVMITNVPGPPVEIHLAGSPLSEMLVWAPVSGHIGLGVSLLSYAGQVRLGIVADAKRVADPRAIVSAYEAELAAFTSTAS